ncbi:snRNA-activating protein complex subunit 4 [Trichonephila clavipes]|nr:snRNA-activating protein complex subunit 4 [Trichonephila clavipes]
MYRNVVRYVMHCRECQRRKSVPQRPPGRLVPIPPAIAPFHRIGIDLLGRFPKSAHGNKWIIVCTDYSTRYAITKALPTAEVDEIAKFLLEEIVLRHGAPRVIITDRGAVFRSRLVSSLVDLCNIDHRFTTAYHPQTNGLTERFNKTLADMLSMYVDVEQKNWDEILPFVTFAYNTAKQETTGFTPFYLLHGREAETTLDTMLPFCPNDFDDNNITKIAARAEESRQLARVHTLRAQDKDRRRYDSKHQMVSYAPGDLVWVYTPTERSAVQCLERYQTCLNKALIKKYWTPEEDKKLMDVVESLKVGKFIPWNRVVSEMEGRERHQIINRYERTINKELKRSPWTKEEDAMLLACFSKFGPHWCKMREFFPGRNTYTLRERYVNILDPKLKCAQWTKIEDQKLISLIEEYGFGKWSKISKEMNGRTDNNCLIRARWLGIKPITNKNGNSSDECPTGIKKYKGKYAKRTRQRKSSKLAIQIAASKTLQEALKEVRTTQEENVDLETLNLSSISITALRELHTELQKNERSCKEVTWKPRYLSLDGVNKKDFTRPQKKRKIETETDSETDGDDIEEVIELDSSETGWLQEVLRVKMGEAADLLNMPAYTKCSKYCPREKIELLIYEEYLKQKMMCSLNHEEEDLNQVYRGVNYNVSIADIVNHFIQPPVSEDNPMILSPNWTTLTGMDMLKASDRSLRNTAKFVDHNKAYIAYLTGYTKNPPKCIKCCNAENTKTCKETFDVVVNAMKSSLIVTDQEMKQAARVETRQSAVQVEDCCCDALANSANAVNLLTHRFISLFLWPFILGTLNLTEKQEELVVTKKDPPKHKKM